MCFWYRLPDWYLSTEEYLRLVFISTIHMHIAWVKHFAGDNAGIQAHTVFDFSLTSIHCKVQQKVNGIIQSVIHQLHTGTVHIPLREKKGNQALKGNGSLRWGWDCILELMEGMWDEKTITGAYRMTAVGRAEWWGADEGEPPLTCTSGSTKAQVLHTWALRCLH